MSVIRVAFLLIQIKLIDLAQWQMALPIAEKQKLPVPVFTYLAYFAVILWLTP